MQGAEHEDVASWRRSLRAELFGSEGERPAAAGMRDRTESETGHAKRFPASITSPTAARRMEAYMESKGLGQTEFAVRADTTDRTLRAFRKTGKVRRNTFDAIAKAMGTTREALLKPESLPLSFRISSKTLPPTSVSENSGFVDSEIVASNHNEGARMGAIRNATRTF